MQKWHFPADNLQQYVPRDTIVYTIVNIHTVSLRSSDDADSLTGMKREQELQQEQAFQEKHGEIFCAYKRRQYEQDPDWCIQRI